MLPTRDEAMALIRDGLSNNPGPWGKHSLTAAHCAEKIAVACGDMDAEKAYVLGLLHDIGRKFGVRHLGHVSDEEMEMIKTELARTVYDDYDRLIQLCDSLAGAEGVLDIEDRMNDVKKRYGFYPQKKWDSNMRSKRYFEKKMEKDIYLVCEKDSFVPEEIG